MIDNSLNRHLARNQLNGHSGDTRKHHRASISTKPDVVGLPLVFERMNSSSRWPVISQYAEAVQNPQLCFTSDELRRSVIATNPLGLPLSAAGQFAVVFKLLKPSSETIALRCFRCYVEDRERTYDEISKMLQQLPASGPLVNFEFNRNGILVDGSYYPTLQMEWVEGDTLDRYIERILNDQLELRRLADQWLGLIQQLKRWKIAHGDLQHGNILVSSGQLRLVDLDGMFVPSMSQRGSHEIGHPDYQHPGRDENFFNYDLDNFSALVIYVSLIGLAEDPNLWNLYHEENLIFCAKDFKEPYSSRLFDQLTSTSLAPSSPLAELSRVLQQACLWPVERCPNLEEIVAKCTEKVSVELPAKLARKTQGPTFAEIDAELSGNTSGISISETQRTHTPPTEAESLSYAELPLILLKDLKSCERDAICLFCTSENAMPFEIRGYGRSFKGSLKWSLLALLSITSLAFGVQIFFCQSIETLLQSVSLDLLLLLQLCIFVVLSNCAFICLINPLLTMRFVFRRKWGLPGTIVGTGLIALPFILLFKLLISVCTDLPADSYTFNYDYWHLGRPFFAVALPFIVAGILVRFHFEARLHMNCCNNCIDWMKELLIEDYFPITKAIRFKCRTAKRQHDFFNLLTPVHPDLE